MSIIGELSSNNQVAMAVAAALEQAMGSDVILAVGLPKNVPPTVDHLPAGDVRVVTGEIVSGADGGVHLALSSDLARLLERRADDEELTTALGGVFDITATAMARVDGIDLAFDEPIETPADELTAPAEADHQFLVYPLLDGTERIATLVIEIGAPMSAADPMVPETPLVRGVSAVAAAPVPHRPQVQPEHVSTHEFPPLHDTAISLVDPRPLSLLHDVEMGVTAELGRRRMTVRDLLGLAPGAVIELDRAAGSPVDVLVNGTLIARGEVVVIDEEFGIRVSEIVAGGEVTV